MVKQNIRRAVIPRGERTLTVTIFEVGEKHVWYTVEVRRDTPRGGIRRMARKAKLRTYHEASLLFHHYVREVNKGKYDKRGGKDL